jgi:hypothetical protein
LAAVRHIAKLRDAGAGGTNPGSHQPVARARVAQQSHLSRNPEQPMSPRLLLCFVSLPLLLAACASQHDSLTPTQTPPSNYKADITAFLRSYLNDPTNVRDASATQPTLQRVINSRLYVVCVRFNAKRSDGKYAGMMDTAAIFNNGRLDRFIDLTPDETASDADLRTQQRDLCKPLAYQPFPELEHMTR